MSRWLRWTFAALLVIVLLLAPSVWVETRCGQARELHSPNGPSHGAARPGSAVPHESSSPLESSLPPEHRREPVNSFLSYPEWAIVFAYEDFAAVQRLRGEPGFDYSGSVRGYWRDFCQVYGLATSRGPVSVDMRAMLHIIGVSFTAEMVVKGLYETTLGFLTMTWRGETPAAEDRFSQAVSDDYARFLRQTPWYEFPFGPTLMRFWRETPFEGSQWLRAIERRLVLSLEWAMKAGYAQVIGLAAGISPAPLTLRSVIGPLDAAAIAREPRITLIDRLPDGRAVIETPRYRQFTEILSGLAEQPRRLSEIAGNREIFVTALGEAANTRVPKGARPVTEAVLQGRAGMVRRGYVVPVAELLDMIRELPAIGMSLEHVYDY